MEFRKVGAQWGLSGDAHQVVIAKWTERRHPSRKAETLSRYNFIMLCRTNSNSPRIKPFWNNFTKQLKQKQNWLTIVISWANVFLPKYEGQFEPLDLLPLRHYTCCCSTTGCPPTAPASQFEPQPVRPSISDCPLTTDRFGLAAVRR